MTAQEIEVLYRTELCKPFPYEDCRRVKSAARIKAENDLTGLVPDLDHYFSFVAGFASSASGLRNRSREQLVKAIPWLEKGFFDWFPNYRPLESLINVEQTPWLFRELDITDSIRIELATIIREMLA